MPDRDFEMAMRELSEKELEESELLFDRRVQEMFIRRKKMSEFEPEFSTTPLTPWEIGEIVQDALSELPADFDSDQIASIYDVVYSAVSLTAEITSDLQNN